MHGDLGAPPLFPEEEAAIARSVGVRRREFATGRRCARLALSALGIPAAPLLPGPRGEPGWPVGVVGAISHCEGYRVAAVALRTDLVTLGVDAEPAAPLPEGVLEAVSLPEERIELARHRQTRPHIPWDRLLFSAKESVYKAWFPVTRRPLEFEEARLSFAVEPGAPEGAHGTFRARLLVPVPPEFGGPADGRPEITGRWLACDGLVLTAVAMAVGQRAGPPRCLSAGGPRSPTPTAVARTARGRTPRAGSRSDREAPRCPRSKLPV